MSTVRRLHRYTYADYVALETFSPDKHEFLDGEIYALPAGSEEHSGLSSAMIYLLTRAAGDRPCRVHTSDLRIYVKEAGLATFPDATVICGPLQEHEPGPKTTALNPTVLVEVTSDSSEEYDTGTKLEFYRTIPSLRDYVIVSHRARQLTVHSRGADGTWMTETAKAGERVRITSLEAELAVDDVYRQSTVS